MTEKAIHEILASAQIADAVALSALLSPERIVTGQNHDRDLPYASVNLESNLVNYRSNKGSARDHRVRITVWHENHAGGSAIADAIATLFEHRSFTTTDARLIHTKHENSLSLQEPDGVWQFLIDIIITK